MTLTSRRGWMVLLCVWVLLAGWLVWVTSPVIVDGLQSLGASSNGPGKLQWPFMADFLGYQRTWGFHWFGWPLLRSLMPWSACGSFFLLALFWAIAAWVVSLAESGWRGLVSLLLVLSQSHFLIAAASYRPEIPTAALLVSMAWLLARPMTASRTWQVFGLSVLLPTMHPLGVVVPGIWCLFLFFGGWKRVGFRNGACAARPIGVGLLVGVALLVGWYLMDPVRLLQFRLNLESQALLNAGLGAGWMGFFSIGFAGSARLTLAPVLVLACFASWRVFRHRRKSWGMTEWFACAVPGAIVFSLVTGNPNTLHLVSVLPMAVSLVVSAIPRSPQSRLTSVVLLFACSAPLWGKRIFEIVKSGGTCYRSELALKLSVLPRTSQLLIPVAMWEAALQQKREGSCLFSTFPNILPHDHRLEYEKQVAADLKCGAIFILDPLQEEIGVYNHVGITAMKQVSLLPGSSPEWRFIGEWSIPVTYSSGQSDRFLLYRYEPLISRH